MKCGLSTDELLKSKKVTIDPLNDEEEALTMNSVRI